MTLSESWKTYSTLCYALSFKIIFITFLLWDLVIMKFLEILLRLIYSSILCCRMHTKLKIFKKNLLVHRGLSIKWYDMIFFHQDHKIILIMRFPSCGLI